MEFFDYQPHQSRIKICGLSSSEDIQEAMNLQLDAIGIVFYPPSARFVAPQKAGTLIAPLVGKIPVVGLVVDATNEEIQQIQQNCSVDIWQFHGNESSERCQAIAGDTPWMKAARIDEHFHLEQFCLQYKNASAWLLDAVVDGYGGGGEPFNWELIPTVWIKENAHRVVLSGGLNALNIIDCMDHFHPLAVDVSSGVERHKGIKDLALMQEFVRTVRTSQFR